MRCRKVKIKLSAFLDGAVGDRERERITSHLEICTSCGEEAKDLLSLSALLEKGEECIKPSPYFWNRLEQRITGAEENKNVFRTILERLNRVLIPATTTATLTIGFFIGIQLGGVIYSGIGEILNPTSFSLIERDVDQTLHLNTLDDFPGESIGGVYYTLITESKSPVKR